MSYHWGVSSGRQESRSAVKKMKKKRKMTPRRAAGVIAKKTMITALEKKASLKKIFQVIHRFT
jgi:hypothetical protein